MASNNRLIYFDRDSLELTTVSEVILDIAESADHHQFVVWVDGVFWTIDLGRLRGFDDETADLTYNLDIGEDAGRQLWVHDGELWYCSTSDVLRKTADEEIREFIHSPGSRYGYLGGDAARKMFEDRSGVIWQGS